MKNCCLIVAALLVASAPLQASQKSDPQVSPVATQLPAEITRVLSAFKMSSDGVSIYVSEAGAETPLLAFDADTPRNPASTIKLLTTYTALERLGPTWTWPTDVYLGGALKDGVLDGDLIIEGHGDPYLVTEKLWLLQRQLRQRGLRHITGSLVIDNDYFAVEPIDAGEFDGQPFRTYNVVPDAMLVNFNAVQFIFRPNSATGQVDIIADPLPANLQVLNQLRLTSGGCRGYQNGISVSVAEVPRATQVTFSGDFGRGCSVYSLSRSVMQSSEYLFGLFKTIWEAEGGRIDGRVRLGDAPDDARPFVTVRSPPLADVIRLSNKWSNNVMTRQIFLTMGAEYSGEPGSVANSRGAIEDTLTSLGLDFPELVLDNGSGLSRDTRIAARSLGRMLAAADASRFRAEFVSSLALAGMDGTMRRRFRNEALTGRMHLKTGRLDDVSSLAGYLRTRTNREFVIVYLHNAAGVNRGGGQAAQDALIRWVYAR